ETRGAGPAPRKTPPPKAGLRRSRTQRSRSLFPRRRTRPPYAGGSLVIMEPGPPQYPPRYPPRDGPGYQHHRPGTAGSLNAPRGDLARSSPVSTELRAVALLAVLHQHQRRFAIRPPPGGGLVMHDGGDLSAELSLEHHALEDIKFHGGAAGTSPHI